MPVRRVVETDLGLLLEWRNAPEIRAVMYTAREIAWEEHRAWFARRSADPESLLLLHFDAFGSADGFVQFSAVGPRSGCTFWGFYAAPGAHAGTGTRLGLDAIDHVFGVCRIHKLNAEVIAHNRRSLDFHHRLGFRDEGVLRQFHYDGSQHCDVVRLGLLGDEWAERRVAIMEHIAQTGRGPSL